MKVYSVEQKKDISESLLSDHPCWGPRSRYFILSPNGGFLNLGTSVLRCGISGAGRDWFGISNDSYYDEGRLWQKIIVGVKDNSSIIIPLPEIENGMYVVQLNTAQGNTRKTIQIIK